MLQLRIADLDLIEQAAAARARDSFWAYRCFMTPGLKRGWFQQLAAHKCQQFYDDLVAGKKPKMVIQAPPQHGKSKTITDFVAWVAGKNADLKTIYASFSDRLGVRANRAICRLIDHPRHQMVFPHSKIAPFGSIGIGQRNAGMVEYLGAEGYFRNTTIRGPVTGESLDLGVIDDPIKGRQEASSETIRDSTWDWLTDDFFTRFSEDAGLLIILTRWHPDDPVGRLVEQDPSIQVVSFPAIATEREKYRRKGEALFPEHKSLEFLLERKKVLTESSFEALYQQNPFIRAGGMFPIDRFQFLDRDPDPSEITQTVRYWDKAGTKDGDGAETAGVRMHRLRNGRFVVSHVEHGRWAALEREDKIKFWANADGYRVKVYVEQEPGSGGKESAERTIAMLAGFIAAADRPTGDKALRAEPYAAQVQGSNVWLVRGAWNTAFIEQHEQFPNGKLKDMVDASSGAFIKVAGSVYDLEALV